MEFFRKIKRQQEGVRKMTEKAYGIEKFYADTPVGDESEKGLKEVVLKINLSNHEWDKFQRQPFYQELMGYLNHQEERVIWYLCDGEKEDCPRTHCYKTEVDGCRYTSDINHAANFKKKETQKGGIAYWENIRSGKNEADREVKE